MPTCMNPECNKEAPKGKKYCGEECLKKALELRRHEGDKLTGDLRDGAFQRGITWRKTKLNAIYQARQAKEPEEQILRELRIGGITVQKARELMRDSEELFGK
jgi:hypothetical protein